MKDSFISFIIMELNELHTQGFQNTSYYAAEEVEYSGDKKWRKKVKKYLSIEYHFDFDNIPPQKDHGPLNQFFIDKHRHSLSVIHEAIKKLGTDN